jgi:hypothetical protein
VLRQTIRLCDGCNRTSIDVHCIHKRTLTTTHNHRTLLLWRYFFFLPFLPFLPFFSFFLNAAASASSSARRRASSSSVCSSSCSSHCARRRHRDAASLQ